MKIIVSFLAGILTTSAEACFVPPPEQRVPPRELIARTKNIVLAQVIRGELVADSEVRYTFKRIAVLSGASDETFTLLGSPAIWEGQISTFDHHTNALFWANGGRTQNDTDCVIRPAFSVGGTYLMFLDRPYHFKSFEQIIRTHGDKDARDKWLQYVENNVRR